MSEPDFPGLLDEVQAAYKPHFADVSRRAARRRRTRAAGVAAAAALALGAAGAVTGLGPWAGGTAPLSPAPTHPTDAPTQPLLVNDAGDLNHLYSVYQWPSGCQAKCEPILAASADQGLHWWRGPIPVPAGDTLLGVTPVGPTTLIAACATAPIAKNDPLTGNRYLSSTDAGRSWHPVTVQAVEAIPAGWRLLFTPPVNYPDSVSVYAADPDTGEVVRRAPDATVSAGNLDIDAPTSAGIWITGQQLMPVPTGSPVPGATPVQMVQHPDGSLTRVVTGPAIVAVSHDGGRTFAQHVFTGPASKDPSISPLVATVDGRTAYAVVAEDDRQVVYRTTDGGAHWAATGGALTRPTSGPMARAFAVQLTLRPDGTLVTQMSTGPTPFTFYASTDGGRSFHPVTGEHPDPRPVPGGYAYPSPTSPTIWLSPDLVHWTQVAMPQSD
jgi:hypothetical protein